MATGKPAKAKEEFLVALACGAPLASAAAKAGISDRTARRWKHDPVFQQRLEDLRTEMRQRAVGMATATSLESIKTLITLQGESFPPAVRLGAARALLEISMKLREQDELATRVVAMLKQVLAAEQAKTTGNSPESSSAAA